MNETTALICVPQPVPQLNGMVECLVDFNEMFGEHTTLIMISSWLDTLEQMKTLFLSPAENLAVNILVRGISTALDEIGIPR